MRSAIKVPQGERNVPTIAWIIIIALAVIGVIALLRGRM